MYDTMILNQLIAFLFIANDCDKFERRLAEENSERHYCWMKLLLAS